MHTKDKLHKVIGIIRTIMDDDEQLSKVLKFLEDEILEEEPFRSFHKNDDHLKDIPLRYQQAIKSLAENITCNLVSFFNPDTLEIEDIPKDMLHEFDFEEDSTYEELSLTHNTWEKCIKVDPLESFESYKIMEDFVECLPDNKSARILSQAIYGKKPFASFNHQIHQSDYRQDWFDFWQMAAEKYVINNYFYDINESTKK